ncbi:hypothetical protein ACIP98_40455 [Streptomyces sp. NPDC088354]|uniref:hypothetical protein n=1 Tax=Streptomyces sp. NPDC088354 TaxID=3365856 RepID=UPI00381E6BB7
MSTRALLFLFLAMAVLVAIAAILAIVGFGIARWGGAEIPTAVTRASFVFASTLGIGIALLAALLPAFT